MKRKQSQTIWIAEVDRIILDVPKIICIFAYDPNGIPGEYFSALGIIIIVEKAVGGLNHSARRTSAPMDCREIALI